MSTIRCKCMTAVTLLGLTAAGRAEMQCPDTLSVNQRADPPTGWSVTYAEQAPRLSGVTIYDGQPANRVTIKYTNRKQSAKELILTGTWGTTRAASTSSAATSAPPRRSPPRCLRGCVPARWCSTAPCPIPGGGFAVKRMVCR